MKFSFNGKVVLVTGSGSGIGQGIAKAFAAEGASVIIADYNMDGAQQTYNMLDRSLEEQMHLCAFLDVASSDSVSNLFSQISSQYKAVDILVNNAGIRTRTPFLELTEKDWDNVMNVNLKGFFLCAQQAARQMVQEKRKGKIVNTSSINAEIAIINQAHYCASKGGVKMLTKALALELAPYSINVNAVGPGVVETNLSKDRLSQPEQVEWLLSEVPLKKIGQPIDIAKAVLFLSSDYADYITGHTLYVDGGWLLS